ncbi:MAG: heliorhodopsin HeR [Candidatus Nanopelagicales bacterium]
MTTLSIAPATAQRLRTLNIIAGFAHLIQMVLILVLATEFTLPVTATYVEGPPGTAASPSVVLFNLSIAWGVAAFFGLSALFHFIVAAPGSNARYLRGLTQRHNYFRWVEYSLSSSIMIVLIAMIVGLSDFAALLAIFGVNASMILFGWLQEKYENPGGGLLPFFFGCLAGIVPWIIIVIYTLSPNSQGTNEIPPFVIGILISLFLLFNSFALIQWLQYKPVGKWSDYLRGERAYIILSLVAKSALAWQVFAGTLVPPA